MTNNAIAAAGISIVDLHQLHGRYRDILDKNRQSIESAIELRDTLVASISSSLSLTKNNNEFDQKVACEQISAALAQRLELSSEH